MRVSYVINSFTASYAPVVTKDKILALQDAMIRSKGEGFVPGNTDNECPVKHHFAPGLYAREMFIPAGMTVVGKTHRFAHLNSVTKGRILVASEFGSREVEAGETFVSQPGIKRCGYALEDTIWVTYHPTEETDLAKIESHVIEPEDFLIGNQIVEVIA